MGQYHSAIMYRNTEWTFADEIGIVDVEPKKYPGGVLKQEIVLGETNLNFNQFQQILKELANEFTPHSYDLLKSNCNHFSDALAKALLDGKGIPSWVNRGAKIGRFFSKFLSSDSKQKMKASQKEQANRKELHQKTRGLTDVDSRENVVEMVSCGNVHVDKAESLNHKANHTLAHVLRGASHFQSGVESDCVLYIPFKSPIRITELRFTCKDESAAPHIVHLFKNKHGNVDLDNAEQMKSDQIVTLEKYDMQKKPKAFVCAVPVKRVKWKGVQDLTIYVESCKGAELTRIDKVEVLGRIEGKVDLHKLQS